LKVWYRSKVILLNLGLFALVRLWPEAGARVCQNEQLILEIVIMINVLLRLITKEKLMVKNDRGTIVLGLLLLVGCSSVPQQLDPQIKYRNDLPFCLENFGCFEGVTVLPRMPTYKFEIAPKGNAKIDLLVVTTCNRNKTFEPGDPGFFWGVLEGFSKFFGKKREGMKYLYVPIPGKEDDGDCPLVLHTYEKELGRHAWAMIKFEHPKYELPATLFCDGDTINFGGVSLCQGKTGLTQWARFPEPVMIEPGVTEKGEKCPMPKKDDTGDYAFRIAKDECGYTVRGISGRYHDLTTTGYVGEVIREVK
jgi:hypothetical protein